VFLFSSVFSLSSIEAGWELVPVFPPLPLSGVCGSVFNRSRQPVSRGVLDTPSFRLTEVLLLFSHSASPPGPSPRSPRSLFTFSNKQATIRFLRIAPLFAWSSYPENLGVRTFDRRDARRAWMALFFLRRDFSLTLFPLFPL